MIADCRYVVADASLSFGLSSEERSQFEGAQPSPVGHRATVGCDVDFDAGIEREILRFLDLDDCAVLLEDSQVEVEDLLFGFPPCG